MALPSTHLSRRLGVAVATLATVASLASLDTAHADTATPSVVFFTPLDAGTVRVASGGSVHLMLGATTDVGRLALDYRTSGETTWHSLESDVRREPGSDVFDASAALPAGRVELRATGYDATTGLIPVGDPVTETVDVSPTDGTTFDFVRPAVGEPLGVFRRADGRAFARASGITTRDEKPVADAPAIGTATVPTLSLPAPTGTLLPGKDGRTYRVPVDLSGNPGLSTGRAVIRVRDSVSSAAVETALYNQAVRAVTTSSRPVAGSSSVTITAKVTDQKGYPVVGAPVHLRGYVNGSRTPVSQVAVSDAHDGLATFTVAGPGFYVPYVDLNLNGFQTTGEPVGRQVVVGTVARSAPGRALYHNNVRQAAGSGTVGDSLRGTRLAAARHYQWIDQDGQLSFTSRAVLRAGAGRVTMPAHLTWVNAHGAPYNPRWMKRGRFETRAWSVIRKRRGLRNADMTFQQNAAYGLSVEWEVKDIRPFTTAAALNAAFAGLAASAQRYYGSAWRSRVQIKMLSNLSGGLPFALKVLRYAHAHGFTTMLLARGAATRTQIPASAHAYVDYVRGAQSTLYPAA